MDFLSNMPVIQVIFAIGCVFIAEKRGGSPLIWFILGLIFGPLAFFVALTAGKKCKHCELWIPKEAKVCGHCGREVSSDNELKNVSLFERIKTGSTVN